MQRKLIFLGLTVGSVLGSYIPALWGQPSFSMASVLLGAVGGIIGIWLGFRLGQ